MLPNTFRYLGHPLVGTFVKVCLAINIVALLYLAVDFQNNGDYYKTYSLPLCLFAVFTVYVFYIHVASYNLAADTAAEALIVDGSGAIHRKTIVYLRPFITDGRIAAELNAVHDAFSTFFFLGMDKLGGFESSLRSALARRFDLIRLDDGARRFREDPISVLRSMFSYRIGRFVVHEDNWESRFHELVETAFAFIVVPPHSLAAATCKEIEYLAQKNLLYKTIFIMPKSNVWVSTLSRKKISAERLWDHLTIILENKAVLPSYNRDGGLVALMSGQFRLVTGISGSPWYRESVIKKCFEHDAIIVSPARDSAKVVFRLVWFTLVLGVAASIIVAMNLAGEISDGRRLLISGALVLPFALIDYYEFCTRFMLDRGRSAVMFVSTVVAAAVGLQMSDSMFTPLTQQSWWAYLSEAHDWLVPIVRTVLILSAPSLLVFVVAFLALSRRRPIGFMPGDTRDIQHQEQ